jgi:hypothetical protein
MKVNSAAPVTDAIIINYDVNGTRPVAALAASKPGSTVSLAHPSVYENHGKDRP